MPTAGIFFGAVKIVHSPMLLLHRPLKRPRDQTKLTLLLLVGGDDKLPTVSELESELALANSVALGASRLGRTRRPPKKMKADGEGDDRVAAFFAKKSRIGCRSCIG
jgi:hypothetical protein